MGKKCVYTGFSEGFTQVTQNRCCANVVQIVKIGKIKNKTSG
jgi:hypothetical protein